MNRWKTAAITLVVLLLAAVVCDVLLYPRATRPLVLPGNDAAVADAQRGMATEMRTTVEEVRRLTFPIVMSLSDRTCVELRANGRVGIDYVECRDTRGKIIERRLGGPRSPM
jgi:hypothetical protein